MRISDWSSDVCSSDLAQLIGLDCRIIDTAGYEDDDAATLPGRMRVQTEAAVRQADVALFLVDARAGLVPLDEEIARWLRGSTTPIVLVRSEEHTSELQSLMRISYAVFCLKKKKQKQHQNRIRKEQF